jgi:hypothetical protein
MTAARSVTAVFVQSFTLTVTKTGGGSGTVTSAPAGIDCGATCSASYDSDTDVTLIPSASFGSIFGGWTGCDTTSTDGNTCTVHMSRARSVSVMFIGVRL